MALCGQWQTYETDGAGNAKMYNDLHMKMTEIVNAVIRKGPPDLSVFSNPVIPELRDEMLPLEAARRDPDFCAYLPDGVPSRFSFESARRFINQVNNSLSVYWHTAGYDNISWIVSTPDEYDRPHIVTADEREKYDLSLYPIPRAGSVPDEVREYVDNPVFQANELSLDIIRARAYQSSEPGDPGWRADFSVLYEDVLVSVNTKGISPEEVWKMLDKTPC